MRNTLTRHVFLVIVFVFVFILVFPVSYVFAESQVSISTSDNLAFIGDRIYLKIIIKTTDDIDKITVKPGKKEFETAAESPTQKRKQQDYTVFEKNIEVVFFKTGDFEIGPFTVQLLKGEEVVETKTTNSVPVTVKTVLTEEDKDIKDLKSPIEVKGNPFYVLKYVIAAVGVTLLIVFLVIWWKHRKRSRIVPEILLSPLQEMEVRLKELDDRRYFDKGKPKQHFIELTQIFKHFLLRSYHFHAEDFTTYETMLVLTQKEADGNIIDDMRFLFNTADLVKFAKFVPDARVLSEVSDKISRILGTYKQRLAIELEKAERELEKETA
jgi:hypothetical protein